MNPVANQDTAIAIVAYNRPDYLQQMMNSLDANDIPDSWRIYAYLDGGPDATQGANEQIIRDSRLGDRTTIVKRASNYGTGRHIIGARRELFDDHHFERVMVLEEDCVLGPNYVPMCTRLMDWSERTYGNVGAVTGWAMCHAPLELKLRRARMVHVTNTHWITYMMTQRCWQAIRDLLFTYEQRFLMPYNAYRDRPHVAIRNWLRSMVVGSHPKPSCPNPVPAGMPCAFDAVEYFGREVFPTGQDACTAVAMYLNGLVKLGTFINRATYIGVKGEHGTQALFDAAGFGKVVLDEMPGDVTNTEFELWTGERDHED